MTLRPAFIGLALAALAVTLLGCVEPEPLPPPPPPPPPVTEAPPPPPRGNYYYVTISSLALRDGPTTSAPQISTLYFNDEVELLGTSDGWGRVLDVRRNIMGWAALRYLQTWPAARPQTAPGRRPAAPKAAPKEQAPAPSETPKEEAPKPPAAPSPRVM